MTGNIDNIRADGGGFSGVLKRENYSGSWGLKPGNNPYGSGIRLLFNYTLNGMPVSSNESRPKTKFFSLLIYAGYPIE